MSSPCGSETARPKGKSLLKNSTDPKRPYVILTHALRDRHLVRCGVRALGHAAEQFALYPSSCPRRLPDRRRVLMAVQRRRPATARPHAQADANVRQHRGLSERAVIAAGVRSWCFRFRDPGSLVASGHCVLDMLELIDPAE